MSVPDITRVDDDFSRSPVSRSVTPSSDTLSKTPRSMVSGWQDRSGLNRALTPDMNVESTNNFKKVNKAVVPRSTVKPGPYSKYSVSNSMFRYGAAPSQQQAGGGSVGTGANPTRRIISASRFKINELRSKVAELSAQLYVLEQENRQLHREATLRVRAIERYENDSTELPSVIAQQTEDTRALRAQVQRQRKRCDKKDVALKKTSEELDRVRKAIGKMKTLIDNKKLGSMEALNRKLKAIEDDIAHKEEEIENLNAKLATVQENHKHEVGIQRKHYGGILAELKRLADVRSIIEAKIEERSKELDMRNIYISRGQRPPHRLSDSIGDSPILDSASVTSQRPPHPPPTKSHGSDTAGLRPEEILIRRKASDDTRRMRAPPLQRESAFAAPAPPPITDEEVRPRRQSEDELLSATYDDLQQLNQESERLEREFEEERRRDKLEAKQRQEAAKQAAEAEGLRRAEQERREKEDAERFANSKEEQERRRNKQILLDKLKKIDENKQNPANDAGNIFVTSRNVVPPVPVAQSKLKRNGFEAKPSTQPMQRAQPLDNEDLPIFGDYRPTFLSTGSAKPRGGDGGRGRSLAAVESIDGLPQDGFAFDISAGSRGDGATVTGKRSTASGNGNSPVLSVGNGSGNARNRSQLLPHRVRQPAASINAAAAANDTDDDIEELQL